MGRTALEIIGQGGLGHSFDHLTEDTWDGYTEAVKAFACVPRSTCNVDGRILSVPALPVMNNTGR